MNNYIRSKFPYEFQKSFMKNNDYLYFKEVEEVRSKEGTMDDEKIIFIGKEVKDLRNEKVYVELDNSVELTPVDLTKIQNLLGIQNSPREDISVTMHIEKNTENYRNMQEFFEDCKVKALLETWRKLKKE